MIDENFKENACILPWACLAVTPGNIIKVCTSSGKALKKIDEDTDLNETWKGVFSESRRDFLNGKVPKTCSACYMVEDIGLRSRRMRFKEWMYDDFSDISNDSKIEYLDINFSNLCNLNCVMCSSPYSSKWIEYDKEIIDEFEFREHVRPFLKIERVPKSFIDQINIQDLKVIEVKGGEPFVEPHFNYFIDKYLAESGKAFMHLTTNLTHFPDKLRDKLHKIKNLKIDVSIDGTGDVYKYIRGEDSSLKKVVQNLYKLVELDNIIRIRINITTTPYNLWNSCSVIDLAKSISPDIKVNWCPMSVFPFYLAPSILPYEFRVDAANKMDEFIKNNNIGSDYTLDMDFILRYLNRKNPEGYEREKIEYLRDCFIKWTDKVNEWRAMNIYDIVPQLGEIKKQWIK